MKKKYGFHVNFKDFIYNSIRNYSMYVCCQIYLGSASRLDFTLTNYDKELTNRFIYNKDIFLYIHSPFNVNLAKRTTTNDITMRRLYDITRNIGYDIARDIGSARIIYHMGRKSNISKDIINIQYNINNQSNDYKKNIILETSSGKSGSEIGSTVNEIRRIYEGLDYTVSLCPDTQHIYSSGMSIFNDISILDDLYDLVNKNIPCLHLNDSKTPFYSQVDLHAPLTKGYIWKVEESLADVVYFCLDKNIHMILEGGDIDNDSYVMNKIIANSQ